MGLSRALEAPSSLARERIDRDAGRLSGTRCGGCGAVSWPGRPVCPRCGGAEAEEALLSDEGTLVTFSTVWVPRPGLPTPYVVGQVDLVDGVRVFAHGEGDFRAALVPCAVRLVVSPEADAFPPFRFELDGG